MPNSDTVPVASPVSNENLPESYSVFLSGELFTQHDLATNVSIKEAVWRLSHGRYQLVLPQSKELRQLDLPNLPAYLRNEDLYLLVQAEAVIARFDGPELDSGTVVEFMVAKMLAKPTIILRTDSRHLTSQGLDDPYNLMLRNWPRTVEVHVDALSNYINMITEEKETHRNDESEGNLIGAELVVVQRGIDALANELIIGLDSVIDMESPYPPELRKVVYEAVRYIPGAGFEQLFSEQNRKEILHKLSKHNTL